MQDAQVGCYWYISALHGHICKTLNKMETYLENDTDPPTSGQLWQLHYATANYATIKQQ